VTKQLDMKFLKRLFGLIKPAASNNYPEIKPDMELLKQKLLAQLEPFKKTAYIPTTERVGRTFSTDSKIGGLPYLRNSGDWPICANCGNQMQLFLQLNLNELPIDAENSLIQLFYCTNEDPLCENDCESYSPFSQNVVCRKIQVENAPVEIAPTLADLFVEKRIIGWVPVDDYPHYDELADLGLDIDVNDYEILEVEEVGIPKAGDKLFGWPHWVQSVEYPFDRKTGSQMNLLFQLDSEVNLPYMFGDCGVGHLTQSPDDENELAFGWACC
jgi:uncharacterized protein YwqG